MRLTVGLCSRVTGKERRTRLIAPGSEAGPTSQGIELTEVRILVTIKFREVNHICIDDLRQSLH